MRSDSAQLLVLGLEHGDLEVGLLQLLDALGLRLDLPSQLVEVGDGGEHRTYRPGAARERLADGREREVDTAPKVLDGLGVAEREQQHAGGDEQRERDELSTDGAVGEHGSGAPISAVTASMSPRRAPAP